MLKATDYIAEYLAKQGVCHVFGYQGGNIAHLIDSIGKRKDMEFIVTYNEQGAAFAACGYALESENIGVALASSGPGAINLISGIANAYYDSIPCIFITGNVSVSTMKKSPYVRQSAFQENDIVSMVNKITKYAVTVYDSHELKYHLEKAMHYAREGRPGPVLLDIPHNVQKDNLDFTIEEGYIADDLPVVDCEKELQRLKKLLQEACRPLIIVGGGMRKSSSKKLFKKILDSWRIPVIATLSGLDVLSHESECYIGFGGAYGNRGANYALRYSDLILILGARMDERFVSIYDKAFFKEKQIIHVDIDSSELGRVLEEELSLRMDVGDFLLALLKIKPAIARADQWLSTIQAWNKRYPSLPDRDDEWCINSAAYNIARMHFQNTAFVTDIGINQMCVAQAIYLNEAQRFYTSAGHGAMGCALPMAIGVAYANRWAVVNCFVGDGALHMNIQELLVLSKNDLPIHVLLNNNQCLGMIRDFQVKSFDSEFTATVNEFCGVDYAEIAEAYHLKYYKVYSMDELKRIKDVLYSNKPCFIELVFSNDVDTIPKLGIDMFSQIPLLSEKEKKRIEKEAFACRNVIF